MGLFYFLKKIMKFIKSKSIALEEFPMNQLCKMNQLNGFVHNGFWQTVDNLKDKKFLINLYKQKKVHGVKKQNLEKCYLMILK